MEDVSKKQVPMKNLCIQKIVFTKYRPRYMTLKVRKSAVGSFFISRHFGIRCG